MGYENLEKTILTRDIAGEDELHPVHITSWGDGERAIIGDEFKMVNFEGSNIVISDLVFTNGVRFLDGENILFHNVDMTGEETNLQNIHNITLHDTNVYGVTRDAPLGEDWSPFGDRISGLFVANTEGLLVEGSNFHQNGWSPDYEDSDGGLPPSQFSHNIYIQFNTTDVTFHDNIVSQGASYGAQFRGGVFAYDNLFLDNNAAVNFLGGDYNNAGPIGNFTFFADNVITSGGHKDAELIGALTWGVLNDAQDTTMLDNIVAHLADPNNPEEIEAKTQGQPGLILSESPFYDDTVIYGWYSANTPQTLSGLDVNVDGLNPNVLDQITIQNFAAEILNDPNASIEEFMDYILTQPDSTISAGDVVAYFQAGFGVSETTNAVQTHRFVPNELGCRATNKLRMQRQSG